MVSALENRAARAGLPPGTLRGPEPAPAKHPEISLIRYSQGHFEEQKLSELPDDCMKVGQEGVIWLDIQGSPDTALLESIGQHCGLHPLVLEDIQNPVQRPKAENYEQQVFIVLRALVYIEKKDRVASHQISLVLAPGLVLSFHDGDRPVFEAVRQRLRNSRGRFRSLGADYLVYALIDVAVDQYFAVLERFAGRLETLETRVLHHATPQTLQTIQRLKRDAMALRKTAWPMRELLAELARGDFEQFRPETLVYLRDVYDHLAEIIDNIENYRDILSGTLDIYLSSVNNRTNEVMKVLTIIATLFIPLTFVTGIFGMNFKYMAILDYPWAFPATLIIMGALGILLLAYFWRKGWLGGGDVARERR